VGSVSGGRREGRTASMMRLRDKGTNRQGLFLSGQEFSSCLVGKEEMRRWQTIELVIFFFLIQIVKQELLKGE